MEDETPQAIISALRHQFRIIVYVKNDIHFKTNLKLEQITDLIKLINEFGVCLFQSNREVCKTDILKMSMRLKYDTPVVYRPYIRLSFNERRNITKFKRKNHQ